jgi:surfactin synthase thioesterase subunit
VTVRSEPPWLRRFVPAGPTRLRLACLPHAGAGGSVFTSWAALLRDDIELVAVLLPGRETRIRDPCRHDMLGLVPDIMVALELGDDVPLALYGHSLGAAVMFEVARLAQTEGQGVAHLAVSGFHAPHLPSTLPPLSHLPHADLIAALSRLGGLHPELLAHDEFSSIVLRAIRADLRLAEDYRCLPGPQLRCPITVMAGAYDPMTPPGSLDGWCDYTAADCTRYTFDGNHFFYLNRTEAVVERINQVLAPDPAR